MTAMIKRTTKLKPPTTQGTTQATKGPGLLSMKAATLVLESTISKEGTTKARATPIPTRLCLKVKEQNLIRYLLPLQWLNAVATVLILKSSRQFVVTNVKCGFTESASICFLNTGPFSAKKWTISGTANPAGSSWKQRIYHSLQRRKMERGHRSPWPRSRIPNSDSTEFWIWSKRCLTLIRNLRL